LNGFHLSTLDQKKFELRLFGNWETSLNGVPMPRLRSRKGQWLLAYLALNSGAEVDRGRVAALLWPDSYDSHSRASLRQTLTDLRSALGSEAWRVESPSPLTLRFRDDEAFVDVIEFQRGIASTDLSRKEAAAILYRGPLLADCTEEWVVLDRSRIEEQYLDCAETVCRDQMA